MRTRLALAWPAALVLSVIFVLAAFAVAQEARDRDRDAPRAPLVERHDDGQRGSPGRGRAPSREPNDEEGTEEGMPQNRSAAPQGRTQTPGMRVDPRILPPPTAPTGWRLGVYAVNTDTGVRITRIVPGGAAARVGLEPRDRIVTVAGYQVGYVDGRLYSLGDELQRRADRGGRVWLLVQDHRSGNLVVMEAQLQRPGQIVPWRGR